MQIKLFPQRRDDALAVIKSGDILTINGIDYDFTPLPDGATLPVKAIGCDWIPADVHRIDGKIHLTLLLPHGPDPQPHVAFPKPLVNPADGVLQLPANIEEVEDGPL